MTIKEAILKSLDDLSGLAKYKEIYDHIVSEQYYDFDTAKTPASTISAMLTRFINDGDPRIKRIKQGGGTYFYYLTKNEQDIDIDTISGHDSKSKTSKKYSYNERDLHKLLSSYLKSNDIYSKTLFHGQSHGGKDNYRVWAYPDMVGIKFSKFKVKSSHDFIKPLKRYANFKISSYKLKKEINSDPELREAFFQTVSNSRWANYGYLIAFEISDSLTDEMERLNQSFGIGIIELNANPIKSKVLFQAKYRDLDFEAVDKLCKINGDFDKFIEQTEKLMAAEERYYKATEKELDELCDKYLVGDYEIENST